MIHPFKGLRPNSKEEIRSIRDLNELFSRDVSQSLDHFAQVRNFMENQQNQFIQDIEPCFYIYRLESQYGCQTGLLALVELNNKSCNIHPHEEIKIDKSELYGDFLDARQSQANPIILLHHFLKPIQILLDELTQLPPSIDIDAVEGCNHKLWVIKNPDLINKITKNYRLINDFYIADGHHRYHAVKKNRHGQLQPYLLSWLISDNQAFIQPYHWIIPTLGSITKTKFLEEINKHFKVFSRSAAVQPKTSNQLGLYIDKEWYQLQIKPSEATDHISIFMQRFLNEKFFIKDIMSTPVEAHTLTKLLDELSYKIAFSFPAISVVDLLLCINSGHTLPPNTTYFVPKPAIGLVSYCDKSVQAVSNKIMHFNKDNFLESLSPESAMI